MKNTKIIGKRGWRKMTEKHKQTKNNVTLGDIAEKSGSLKILRRKEMDIILFNLRKIGEDLNKMELFFCDADMKLTPDKAVRWNQFIRNNKNRLRESIWSLSWNESKEEFDKEEEI